MLTKEIVDGPNIFGIVLYKNMSDCYFIFKAQANRNRRHWLMTSHVNKLTTLLPSIYI